MRCAAQQLVERLAPAHLHPDPQHCAACQPASPFGAVRPTLTDTYPSTSPPIQGPLPHWREARWRGLRDLTARLELDVLVCDRISSSDAGGKDPIH
jgi:hypothetical protein